jgi:hypothetical protein
MNLLLTGPVWSMAYDALDHRNRLSVSHLLLGTQNDNLKLLVPLEPHKLGQMTRQASFLTHCQQAGIAGFEAWQKLYQGLPEAPARLYPYLSLGMKAVNEWPDHPYISYPRQSSRRRAVLESKQTADRCDYENGSKIKPVCHRLAGDQ